MQLVSPWQTASTPKEKTEDHADNEKTLCLTHDLSLFRRLRPSPSPETGAESSVGSVRSQPPLVSLLCALLVFGHTQLHDLGNQRRRERFIDWEA